ncbi:hypothetical protein BDY24DRAFT_339325 [Mrakia frigida]|uniref:uncharacterized protein n=1 Tax=Mrakia frigida TaxID=29902 RepID=UPI003FCBFB2B
MRLSSSLLGPLRLPKTLGETLRLLPSTPSTPSSSSSASSSSSTSPPPPSVVQGWISSLRTSKNVAFIGLNDGTLDRPLQVVVLGKKTAGGMRSIVEELSIGASLKITGPIIPSPGPGQPVELQASALEVLGFCDGDTYPIHPDRNPGAERPILHLREYSHLRPRELETQSVIKLRDQVSRGWRSFFEENDFIHINTPILTSSDCEGAGEVFSVISQSSPKDDPFFPSPGANLTVSSQLHLELYLPTHPRVYTLSPAFRAEPGISRRHLAEFWMLEAEVAFVSSVQEVMDVCEEGVKSVLRRLVVEDGSPLGVFAGREEVRKRIDDAIGKEGGEGWMRLSYTEAVDILQRHEESLGASTPGFIHRPIWGASLSSEHEKFLAGKHAKGPVFVYDYPSELKPFYMLPTPGTEGERKTAACFDLLVPDVGELAGGSMREHRLTELVEVMNERKMRLDPMEWYIDTRRYGTVPHGGFGLGFERMLSWVTGVSDVKDIVGFGRWKGNCRY